MTCTDALKTRFKSWKTFTILSTICVNSSFVIATDSGSRSDNPYKPSWFVPLIRWTIESMVGSAQNKKTPQERGVFLFFSVSSFAFRLPSFRYPINNLATGLLERHAISANAKGAAACVALSPQSGECVRGSRQMIGQLLQVCVRCHRPAQIAS